MSPLRPPAAARALELATVALSRPGAPATLPDRLLVVDPERANAVWFEDGEAPPGYEDVGYCDAV